MNLYEINYGLNLIVQLMLGVFLFNNLCKNKHGFVVTLICYYLPFLLIQILSLHYTKLPQAVYSMLKMSLTVIILMTFYDAGIKQALKALALFTFLQLICEFPSIGIVKILGYNIFSDYSSVNGSVYITVGRIFIINLFLVVILASVYLYSRKKDNDIHRVTDLLMIFVFDVLHMLFLIFYYKVNFKNITETDNLIQIIFQGILIMLLLIQYHNTRRTRSLIKTEQELQLMKEEMENNYKYYLLAESRFDDVSGLVNELSEQIGIFREQMKTQPDSLKTDSFMDNINKKLNSIKAVNYCANKTVNAVLTLKLNEERVRPVNTQLVLRSCEVLSEISDYDLCSLFSNLFDNAVNSCLRTACPEKSFIEMKSDIKNEYFVLRVSNSCEDSEAELSSPKSAGHGYGLRITQDICRRNGGELILDRDGNVMHATVFLRNVQA